MIPDDGCKWICFCLDSVKNDVIKSLCGDLSWTFASSLDDRYAIYASEVTRLLDLDASRYVQYKPKRVLKPWFDEDCTNSRPCVDPCVDRESWIQQLKEHDTFFRTKERLYWSALIAYNCLSPKRPCLDLLKWKSGNVASPSSAECRLHQAESFVSGGFNGRSSRQTPMGLVLLCIPRALVRRQRNVWEERKNTFYRARLVVANPVFLITVRTRIIFRSTG